MEITVRLSKGKYLSLYMDYTTTPRPLLSSLSISFGMGKLLLDFSMVAIQKLFVEMS